MATDLLRQLNTLGVSISSTASVSLLLSACLVALIAASIEPPRDKS